MVVAFISRRKLLFFFIFSMTYWVNCCIGYWPWSWTIIGLLLVNLNKQRYLSISLFLATLIIFLFFIQFFNRLKKIISSTIALYNKEFMKFGFNAVLHCTVLYCTVQPKRKLYLKVEIRNSPLSPRSTVYGAQPVYVHM